MVSCKLTGLLVISLDSGILLFSESYDENFGFTGERKVDPMQFSSTVFALHKMSLEQHASVPRSPGPATNQLKWITMESQLRVYFYESTSDEEASSFLLAICCDSSIPINELDTISSHIGKLFKDANISTLHSPRQSSLRAFRESLHAAKCSFEGRPAITPEAPITHVRLENINRDSSIHAQLKRHWQNYLDGHCGVESINQNDNVDLMVSTVNAGDSNLNANLHISGSILLSSPNPDNSSHSRLPSTDHEIIEMVPSTSRAWCCCWPKPKVQSSAANDQYHSLVRNDEPVV